MQRLFALVCLIVLFVVASEARFGHSHLHHKEGASNAYPTCHFMAEKGTYDLRLLMRDLQDNDWELRTALPTPTTGSALYFNPCSGVSLEPCPKGSALCQTSPKGAISFGNVSAAQWTEVDGGVQITYDNGEMCNNGSPRKTVVQFTCSEPNKELSTHLTSLTNIVVDECMVTVQITSMYGCPVEQLCSVFDKPSCEHSEGLCDYNKKDATCSMASVGCTRIGGHHVSHGVILSACVAAFSLFICLCGCCSLACRKRRQCRSARRARLARTSRKLKKAPVVPAPIAAPVKAVDVDEESVVPLEEQQQAVYIPMQQPVYMYQPQQTYYAPHAFTMPSVGADQLGAAYAALARQQQHGIN